jgi:hypothetical protein
MDWLDSLCPAQEFLYRPASLPGVDTSQPGKGIPVYLAVRLQLIKVCCFASWKTCAAVIEKTTFLFHAHRSSGYLLITFAFVEASGQFLTTKKLSDGFCQGPGTQKLIECGGCSLYSALKTVHVHQGWLFRPGSQID